MAIAGCSGPQAEGENGNARDASAQEDIDAEATLPVPRADLPFYWVRSAPFQVFAFYGADPNGTFDAVPPYNDSTNYSQAGFSGIHTSNFPAVAAVAEATISGIVPHAWIETTSLSAATPMIDAWTDTPLHRAWYLKDEPTSADIPGMAEIASYLRIHSPRSLIYVTIEATNVYDPATQTWPTNTSYLDDLFTQIAPDALAFDHYPYIYDFATGSIPQEEMYPGWGPTQAWHEGWFNTLATTVNYVKAHNAANNTNVFSIAVIQSFAADTRSPPITGWYWRNPSESELRFQAYSALTAGVKGIGYYDYWPYTTEHNGLMMLSPPAENSTPSPLWSHAANANIEIRNLGRYLRYLTNKSFYFVPSPGDAPPPGLTTFSPSQPLVDGKILSITPDSPFPGHDGMVGFFWDDTQARWYFMLTNLLRTPTASATEAGQNFTIQFDSSVNTVYRLNRSNGEETALPLTADHKLVVNLPGGTGDLFAYDEGIYGTGWRPMGTVSINNDDAVTQSHDVTINMQAFAAFGHNSVSHYAVSLDGGATFGSWLAYAPTSYQFDDSGMMSASVTLPAGAGDRSVAIKYKDTAGRESPITSSVIYCSQ